MQLRVNFLLYVTWALPTLLLWTFGKGIPTSFSSTVKSKCLTIFLPSAKKSWRQSRSKIQGKAFRLNVTNCTKIEKKQKNNVTTATEKTITSRCKGFKIRINDMTSQITRIVQSHVKKGL